MKYRLELHEVPAGERRPLLEARGFRIFVSPVLHGAPNIALRAEFDLPDERGAVTYSSDTSPCPSLAALARGADVLIHEATLLHVDVARATPDGHTTAYQAGEIARRAGVDRLMLCHFHATLHERLDEVRREAEQAFGRPVEIPAELTEYRL
jgi:ribonuclease BN (tRNA processing enzyme)